MKSASSSRYILWVDAVGGFLLCLADEVRVGQALPEGGVEIPIIADLSRHHATIRRDAAGYSIEPVRDVGVNGKSLSGPTWLADGSSLQLGKALRIHFRRPHPLSATARLDFLSRHRTQPSTSAVLLMAETCVLGPSSKSHVVCRDWPHDVVLHRQEGQLFCRTPGRFELDGQSCQYRAPLLSGSRVSGEGFSFCLEEI